MTGERVELKRDCDVVAIPQGHTITLPQGTEAYIAQSLGGVHSGCGAVQYQTPACTSCMPGC